MAEIELAPLSHRLDDDEMKTLVRLLEEAGAPRIAKADEHSTHTIAARLSEEALTEFLDQKKLGLASIIATISTTPSAIKAIW